MQIPEGLLEPAAQTRLQRALAGTDESHRLQLGSIQPGDIGVITATVRQVHPARPYERKRGGTGLVGRVTLADRSGEVDIVLWDDETRLLQDGPFQAGAALCIQGASVRAGRRGGVELSLGSAIVTRLAATAGETASPLSNLSGTLLSVGPTRIVGSPPRERFQADIQVDAVGGVANLVAEGDLVKQLRQVLPGAPVHLEGLQPHPLLDQWWLAGPGTTLSRCNS